MKKEMSKVDAQAKMEVLKELYDMCSAKLKDKVKGALEPEDMKQVTVAAPDSESLEEGLEMAQELAPKVQEMSDEEKPSDDEKTDEGVEEMTAGLPAEESEDD